jgi:hypothetical protein
MANTIVVGRNCVHLTAIDTDWTFTDSYAGCVNGVRVHSIMVSAAGADTIVLEQGSVSGPIFFKRVFSGAGSTFDVLGEPLLLPVLDVSDGSYTAGTIVSIMFSKP